MKAFVDRIVRLTSFYRFMCDFLHKSLNLLINDSFIEFHRNWEENLNNLLLDLMFGTVKCRKELFPNIHILILYIVSIVILIMFANQVLW